MIQAVTRSVEVVSGAVHLTRQLWRHYACHGVGDGTVKMMQHEFSCRLKGQHGKRDTFLRKTIT